MMNIIKNSEFIKSQTILYNHKYTEHPQGFSTQSIDYLFKFRFDKYRNQNLYPIMYRCTNLCMFYRYIHKLKDTLFHILLEVLS